MTAESVPLHLPTLRDLAPRLRAAIDAGAFDGLSGRAAAERIAEALDTHIATTAEAQGDPSTWTTADWQRWHDLVRRQPDR